MKGDVIEKLSIQIYQEIYMPDQTRIIQADPIEDRWKSIDLANHNIFRLDADNQVIWQVVRDERFGVADEAAAESLEKQLEEKLKPFLRLESEFYELDMSSISSEQTYPKQSERFKTYHPGCYITAWAKLGQDLNFLIAYDINIETGLARRSNQPIDRW
jgi:hypothetical protein